MASPRSSVDAASTSSSSESHYSSSFLLGSQSIPSEKGSSSRTRTASTAFLSLSGLRRRAIYVTVAAIFSGILFANLCFTLASSGHRYVKYQDFTHYLSERIRSQRNANSINNSLLSGSRPTVVALVSFSTRSRTEILDCYLKQNLVKNGGLLDRVIFSPENTTDAELDWLRGVVVDTDGYNLLDSDDHDIEPYHPLADKLIPLRDSENINGAVGRSWKLAETLAQHLDMLSIQEQPESLFLFINSETIYISPNAIASMIYTQHTQPEFSIVQANMVNQPVLSWLHNNMGIVKPYRPEGQYFFTKDQHEDGSKVFDALRDFLDGAKTKRDIGSSSPWRASELPLWSLEETTESAGDENTNSPLLFGIPIDFKPPQQKHRWLPYDERQTTDNTQLNFRHRPSLTTPLTQHIFSLTGPGKWPWTLSAQTLYSFLEHLEEEHDLANPGPNATIALVRSGLARYSLPLWTFSASPPLAPSFFILSSSTLQTLSSSFPYHIDASHQDEIPEQQNEEPTLAKWITSEKVVQMLGGKGAVVDGNAITARFLPGRIGKSEWLDVDRKEVGRGLEGTDLLERFAGYAKEVGCRAI
jgi:hypothetical protein